MAYQTGSFQLTDTFQTVYNTLAAFATAEGWTVTGAYPDLIVTKNQATFFKMRFDSTNPNYLLDDTKGPTGNARAQDFHIDSWFTTATPGTEGDQNRQTDTYLDRAQLNDWVGPYSEYWAFSGNETAGDPPYIYFVVKKANGNYCFVMLGTLDKKGIAYDGGEFITGNWWNWNFPAGSAYDPNSNGSGTGSDPFNYHGFPGDYGNRFNIRAGAATTSPGYPFVSQSAGNAPYKNPIVQNMVRAYAPKKMEDLSLSYHRFQGHIYWLGPNTLNGVTPLFEVPVFMNSLTKFRMTFLGSYPNYRACSMLGRTEAEEITFGSDNWIVFPIKAYRPWFPEPYAAHTLTSAMYGHAIKVIN